MKKILVLFIALALFANVNAQGFSGGLYIGPNLSWISSDSWLVETHDMKFGYTFGGVADIGFTDNFLFTVGARFNNVGGTMSFKGDVFEIKPEEFAKTDTLAAGEKFHFNLNYVAFPGGFKFKTNEIENISYYLTGGVTPMLNIKARAKVEEIDDVPVLLNNHILFFNLGWHVGGGIEYGLVGDTRLMIELVYTGGLTSMSRFDVHNDRLDDPDPKKNRSDPKMIINDIHLKIGVLF